MSLHSATSALQQYLTNSTYSDTRKSVKGFSAHLVRSNGHLTMYSFPWSGLASPHQNVVFSPYPSPYVMRPSPSLSYPPVHCGQSWPSEGLLPLTIPNHVAGTPGLNFGYTPSPSQWNAELQTRDGWQRHLESLTVLPSPRGHRQSMPYSPQRQPTLNLPTTPQYSSPSVEGRIRQKRRAEHDEDCRPAKRHRNREILQTFDAPKCLLSIPMTTPDRDGLTTPPLPTMSPALQEVPQPRTPSPTRSPLHSVLPIEITPLRMVTTSPTHSPLHPPVPIDIPYRMATTTTSPTHSTFHSPVPIEITPLCSVATPNLPTRSPATSYSPVTEPISPVRQRKPVEIRATPPRSAETTPTSGRDEGYGTTDSGFGSICYSPRLISPATATAPVAPSGWVLVTPVGEPSVISIATAANNTPQTLPASTPSTSTNSAQSKQAPKRVRTRRRKKCDICTKEFASRAILSYHLRAAHNTGPRDLKDIQCEVCNKVFTHPASLQTHRRQHTGERPFSCPVCGMTFADRAVYNRHLRCHTQERPYTCSECGVGFTQSCNLQRHIRQGVCTPSQKREYVIYI